MVAAALHRRAPRGSKAFAAVIVSVGRMIGLARLCLPFLPGLGGAVLVSVATGEIASHVFGHGLAPWVAGFVGALFLLKMDGQIKLRPSRGGE